jgi:subfamily B ATP-binding cassette protein MsbA
MGRDNPSLKRQAITVLRFVRFAAPHWKLMVTAMLAMSLTSAMGGSLLLLGRPVFEGLTTRAKVTEEITAPSDADADTSQEVSIDPDEYLPESLTGLKTKFTTAVSESRPIAWLQNYVAPGPNQIQHVAYLILGCIVPLWIIAAFFETYCTEKALWSVMADIRVAVFEKLSGMPLSFFARHRSGDLISRLTNDISNTKNAAKLLFSDMFKHPIQLGVLLIVATYSNWMLTLMFLAFAPVVGVLMSRYGSRIQRHGRKTLERIGDITEAISQLLSGLRVVKAFGMEEQENAQFREQNRRQLRRAFKLVRNRAWADSLPQAVVAVMFGLLLLVAHHLLEKGLVDVPSLIPLVGAVACMPRSIKRIVKSYTQIRQHIAAFDRIYELLDAESEIKDDPDAIPLPGIREGIHFDHVWFAYNDDDYVLRDINTYISAGTVCALVGETGAGKSTMLDLIPRFHDPSLGAVKIDGQNIKRIHHKSLLENIAIVGQHPFLFNRTVKENIRYGRSDATDEEIIEAAQAANIHELIDSLPEKYDTVVGEQGSRFSGGQRQCITIARAILKDAPLLILDEATSSLDSESEQMVQQALSKLMEGRTVFVIAHRLSTVRFADKIVVLKAGQIVEEGTHKELIEKDGEYAKFYKIQFADPASADTAQI